MKYKMIKFLSVFLFCTLLCGNCGASLVEKKESGEKLIASTLRADIIEVKLLLEAGADPNAVDINGNTALFYAQCLKNEKMVALLVEHKADIEVRSSERYPHALPRNIFLDSLIGGQKNIANILINYGARLDRKHPITQKTPLVYASQHGWFDMVQFLLKHKKIDILARSDSFGDAVYYAQTDEIAQLIQREIKKRKEKAYEICAKLVDNKKRATKISLLSSENRIHKSSILSQRTNIFVQLQLRQTHVPKKLKNFPYP